MAFSTGWATIQMPFSHSQTLLQSLAGLLLVGKQTLIGSAEALLKHLNSVKAHSQALHRTATSSKATGAMLTAMLETSKAGMLAAVPATF